jgi:hypothetical protein
MHEPQFVGIAEASYGRLQSEALCLVFGDRNQLCLEENTGETCDIVCGEGNSV